MNREKSLAVIRQKCIEANPEIVKLNFGCEVRLLKDKSHFGHEVWKRFGANIWQYDDGKFRLVCGPGWADIDLFQSHRDSWEILGRPIRVADVLLALNYHSAFEALHFVTDAGVFGQHVTKGARGVVIEPTAYIWDFRKDNLIEQSDECIKFLADTLR